MWILYQRYDPHRPFALGALQRIGRVGIARFLISFLIASAERVERDPELIRIPGIGPVEG
ncbi:MAG: hypothetical protein A2W68_13935 [Betaproteobacteria bacterium RIFCSPLOWO2_02_64_14]|nr:MAG: hypothetical protein A2W68_13935 [Betaproteobacteria bacterium RIFCSPLOWO2_02_64_14]